MISNPKSTPYSRNCATIQTCYWIYQLVVIVLGLYMAALIVGAYQQVKAVKETDSYKHGQEIINTWKKGYIIDIVAVTTNNCPESYEPLLNQTWPGTLEGCVCRTAINSHIVQWVLNGACSSALLAYNCTKIPSKQAQKMTMWKGQKLLCLKRAKAFSFYNSTQTLTVDGRLMKNCSNGTKHQVNTYVEISCPLTMASNLTVGASQKTLPLDSVSSFNYITENGYPIADFKLSENFFCPYFDQPNITPFKNGSYVLNKVLGIVPCTKEDPRMVEIDSMDEHAFYTNNTRIYQLISSLPAYPRPSSSYTYKLGYITYQPWAMGCRNTSTHNLHETTKIITLNSLSWSVQVGTGVSLMAVLLFAVAIRLVVMIQRGRELKAKGELKALFLTDDQIAELMPTVNFTKSYSKYLALFVFEMVLRGCLMFSILYVWVNATDLGAWLRKAFTQQCTNSYFEAILRLYEIKANNIAYEMTLAALIWFILVVVDIVHFYASRRWGMFAVNQHINHVEQVQAVSEEQVQMNQKQQVEYRLDQSAAVIMDKEQAGIKVIDVDASDHLMATGQQFYAAGNLDYQEPGFAARKRARALKKKKNLIKDNNNPKVN